MLALEVFQWTVASGSLRCLRLLRPLRPRRQPKAENRGGIQRPGLGTTLQKSSAA
jgi:hypothetical protein